MKTKLILFIWAALLFNVCYAQNKVQVADLRCEHLTDPLSLEAETPRFSWKITDPGHTRGQQQTAYRILVASTSNLLENNTGDVWDSGVVSSETSHLVPYNGANLQANKLYFWKVMVYDKDNQSSEWSVPARFSIALPNRSDWKGEWIKHPITPASKHIWFRKGLHIDGKVTSAFAYVASVGYHELYVNGKKVDDRVLAPALSRLDKRVYYVTYTIDSLLVEGDNMIAVWYAGGWSRYTFFAPLVNQALLMQVNGTTENGDFTLHTDPTWKCSESSSKDDSWYGFGNMNREEINGQRAIDGWNTTSFNDQSWMNAVATSPVKTGDEEQILTAQATNPSRVIERLTPQSIIDTLGLWRVDMGKNFTGFLEINLSELPAGSTITIEVSNRKEAINDFAQTQYYISRGEAGETFRNRFNIVAGRYIHLTGLSRKPNPEEITAWVVSSAGERSGSFTCSDELFNRIHEIDAWTYQVCTTEGFTVDCPHRERLGYGTESGWATAWGLGMPVFESAPFYAHNIVNWGDVQMPNGWIHNTAPQINEHFGGPMYSSAVVQLAYEHYLAYGDKKVVEKAYPTTQRWLNYLAGYIVDGVLMPYDVSGKYLGEWTAPGMRYEYAETEGSQFFNNCVYAVVLDLASQLAGIIGETADSIAYAQQRETLLQNVHNKYFNTNTNRYVSGNQLHTIFPMFAGVTPAGLHSMQIDHLKNNLTGSQPYFDYGTTGRYPYLRFMLEHPELYELFSSILSKKTYPSYGHFIANGETTWPEYWETNMDSDMHTSYTGISLWFIKGLCGIEPMLSDPAYRTISIHPHVINKLTWAKATINSPYGQIESGWKKEQGKVIYNIAVPVGARAILTLPAASVNDVKESGLALDQADGIQIRQTTGNSITLEVSSGQYQLEVANTSSGLTKDLPANRFKVYPNPVDNSTMLHIDLDRTYRDVSINIYNSTGTLVQTVKENGRFLRIPFNFSSGVYTAQVNIDKEMQTYKILLK